MTELVERIADAKEALRRKGWEADTAFLPEHHVDRLASEADTAVAYPTQDGLRMYGLDVLEFDADDYGLVVDNRGFRGGILVYPEAVRPIEVDS